MIIQQNKLKCLFILFLHVSVMGYAQQKKYSFSFKDAGLAVVIKELADQSKTNILYNPSILPGNLTITGNFKNLTLKQSLDTFLTQAQIMFRFYKGDIVLYKKNEDIKETHQLTKPKPQKKDMLHEIITDTVTYSIVTFDTIVTKLTDYVKVPVNDTVTIKVYDTIRIRQTVPVPSSFYRPKQSVFIAGLSFSQAAIFETVQLSDAAKPFSGIIKSSVKAKSSNSIGLNFIYKGKKWMVESGVYLSKHQYDFTHTTQTQEIVTVIDTIDRYFTNIAGSDTTWVYVTKERQTERIMEKKYASDLKYRYIAVPILVGYTMIVKNFTFEFKGGVLCNFYAGSKGAYLTISGNNALSVETVKAPNSTVIISAMGAVGIDYFLNKQFHIFGQPFITWAAFPIGNRNVEYSYTSLQIGILAGIRYYFKN